ncbi:GvpL/GvpF family gas vesicle protein [Streptomyces sp. NPDC050560]|uniref:GvpL/GvpF family gas vesicle protein n=1 Tax=Streptomyces sp. NPDC050560 TaxID=3365630 RepID=UPI0037A386B7
MTRTLPRHTPAPGTDAPTATYVFAVCRGCDPAALAATAGQPGGGHLRLLPFGGLAAVVQDVPADGFGERALPERLADPARLEECARAHHAVVTAAAAVAPTLPLPLATLYLGDARAAAALGGEEDRFRGALERIADRVEWGVKLHALRTPGPVPATAPAAGREARPGHAYLERLRGARQERERRQEAGVRAAETVDRALRAVAVACRRLRTHDTSRHPELGAQLLNAAYLVPRERQEELAALVERLRGSDACRGVEMRVTGPWVPYSFVEEEAPDAGR